MIEQEARSRLRDSETRKPGTPRSRRLAFWLLNSCPPFSGRPGFLLNPCLATCVLLSPVSRPPSPAPCLPSPVSCFLSPVPMDLYTRLLPFTLFSLVPAFAANTALRESVASKIAAEYTSLEALYKDLHAQPELSLMEERTAGVVARELRAAGFEVTQRGGGHGVVGVLKNRAGTISLI